MKNNKLTLKEALKADLELLKNNKTSLNSSRREGLDLRFVP